MASLGNALVNKILGHSAAEKAFRPWWDNLEDFLIYGLVMLGLLTVPTSVIIGGTPLDCNFCQKDHCKGKFGWEPGSNATEDPKFNAWWVKKYCTQTAVDVFILYFPYILFMMALAIVLIERVFIRIFKAGIKLDTFYNLLVKDTLSETHKEATPPPTAVGDAVDGPTAGGGGGGYDLEDTRAALEVSHSFSRGSNYFLSYALRTLTELVLAVLLLAWIVWRGVPAIQAEEFIFCDVHGYQYECTGHPQQFYMYVLFVAIAVLIVYLLCSFYNLLWLSVQRMVRTCIAT